MIQLVYASRSEVPAGRSMLELRSILKASQLANLEDGLTGFLIADGRSFFQVLEGHPSAVRSTFERIEADRRHSAVKLLRTRAIFSRSFSDWSMGGWMVTRDTLGIFVRHGLSGQYDHQSVTAAQVLSLAQELRGIGAAVNVEMRMAG
jgi:hypothetical protein